MRIAFGLRHIVLVHHRPHETEQKMLGHRRWHLRLACMHVDGSPTYAGEHFAEGRNVVDVLQTFAGGLEQQREVLPRARRGQQLGGPQPLLP